MPFRIAQLPCDDTFSHHFSVALLERIYPRDLVCDLLTQFQLWEERERKLNQLMMVSLLIAWHLFLNESMRSVFLHLSASLRLVGNLSMSQVPTKGAFLHRRKQLGVRLLRTLLRRVCQPLATPPHARSVCLWLPAGRH